MSLPDPQLSQVVLIGTSRYDDEKLPDLPQVRANIRDLSKILTDSLHGVVPASHCITVEDEEHISRIGRPLRTAQEAKDLLLVYYSGHGLIGGTKHDLYLALSGSEWNDPEFTSLEYDKLRNAVLASPARTKVIVLDCCFSGRVISDTMAGSMSEIAGQVEVEGTYVLTSSLRDKVALSLPGEEHTAFTGRLIRLLENGMPRAHELLTIEDLYLQLYATMRSEGLPLPQKRGTGNVEMLALARNRAYVTKSALPQADKQTPAPHADKGLDWETVIQSLRDLTQQHSPDSPSPDESPEPPGDPLERAVMLRDALSGHASMNGADRSKTSPGPGPSVEGLEAWGYRERAAAILRILYPGPSVRRARRQQLERHRRNACVDLFQTIWELRTHVAGNFYYHGSEIEARLAWINSSGRTSQIHAISIALLGPEDLIKPAEELAAAAIQLADSTADGTRLELGAMIRPPDFTDLDRKAEEFRQRAVAKALQSSPKRMQADAREACVRLFRAGWELRACVANNVDYHGGEEWDRLLQVRAVAATGQVEAFNLALMAPIFAEEARVLATAALRLAAAAEVNTDLVLGASIRDPDFSELDSSAEIFRLCVIAHARRIRPERARVDISDACRGLLTAISDLRMHVTAYVDSVGSEAGYRLEQARTNAAAVQVEAFNLALETPDLAEETSLLAMAALRLVTAAEVDLGRSRGASIWSLDFSELDSLTERLHSAAAQGRA